MIRFARIALLVIVATTAASAQRPEATSLFGKPLVAPSPVPGQQKLEADLVQAEKALAAYLFSSAVGVAS